MVAVRRQPGFDLDGVADVRRHQTFEETGVASQDELVAHTRLVILPHDCARRGAKIS